jgi:hypothetical protein
MYRTDLHPGTSYGLTLSALGRHNGPWSSRLFATALTIWDTKAAGLKTAADCATSIDPNHMTTEERS